MHRAPNEKAVRSILKQVRPQRLNGDRVGKVKDQHKLATLYEQHEGGSIVVRAHAFRAEGLRFEPDSMP